MINPDVIVRFIKNTEWEIHQRHAGTFQANSPSLGRGVRIRRANGPPVGGPMKRRLRRNHFQYGDSKAPKSGVFTIGFANRSYVYPRLVPALIAGELDWS